MLISLENTINAEFIGLQLFRHLAAFSEVGEPSTGASLTGCIAGRDLCLRLPQHIFNTTGLFIFVVRVININSVTPKGFQD